MPAMRLYVKFEKTLCNRTRSVIAKNKFHPEGTEPDAQRPQSKAKPPTDPFSVSSLFWSFADDINKPLRGLCVKCS
jgi:hypothetical protein